MSKYSDYTVDTIYEILRGNFKPEINSIEDLSLLKLKAREFKYKRETDLFLFDSCVDVIFTSNSCDEELRKDAELNKSMKLHTYD